MIKDDNVIRIMKFCEINLEDSFFDSLKENYAEFSEWFLRKSNEVAFVSFDERNSLQGFLYLKIENGAITDVSPPINCAKILKVGTFKINAHNTKLGERFVKKVFDYAIEYHIPHIYVTVFNEYQALINLLCSYGFKKYGQKTTVNGTEDVFIKDFQLLTGNTKLDYPIINTSANKWLIAIKEQYHTKLFPDSILRQEDSKIIADVTHTNSIHKIYVGRAYDFPKLCIGDILIPYWMNEQNKAAYYNNVITSLCVVEEIRPFHSFKNNEEFFEYSEMKSVFNKDELASMVNKSGSGLYAIKMTYNIAIPRRLNRKALMENVGLNGSERWTLYPVSNMQFEKIIELGKVYEGIIIH